MFKKLQLIKIAKVYIIVLVLLGIISNAQAQSGIYYEESNFTNGITNYQIPCPLKLSNEDLYDFYNSKYIKLSEAESIKKFKKKDIWGYRDCKKFDWRIENNVHYKIIENDAMVLYLVDYPLNASRSEFKIRVVANYYFSKDVSSDILPLSLPILIGEFSDNPKYIKSIKEYLGTSHGCIHCYDVNSKSYMINKLLKESLYIHGE